MKILMISAGLPPKRTGGLPLYVSYLHEELARRGHDIIYLATNAADVPGRPRITRLSESVNEYSLVSSGNWLPWEAMPLPLSDVRASRRVKKCLVEFVDHLRPDIIHIHEILCFPVELVTLLRSRGYKLIFTAQDYASICPTIQLFRHDGQLCTLQAHELQCGECVRRWRSGALRPIKRRLLRSISGTVFDSQLTRTALRYFGGALDRMAAPLLYRGSLYRHRRIKFVEHFKSFDLILCMSQMQRDLISNIVGDGAPIRHIYLSLPTYGTGGVMQRANDATTSSISIRFGALNVDQETKGRGLLLEGFGGLRRVSSGAELHLFGRTTGESIPGVFYHGSYQSSDLDTILSAIDVGVIPSIWPEAYAYVGPEMLTRGVPLIVSSAGAMREYVIPYFNGLHFDPAKIGALQAAMQELACNPQLLAALKANAPHSSQGIRRFNDHVDEMEMIYAQLLGASPEKGCAG
jgi:glycosyltransferase involved in cell wall biosynthesis